MPGSTAEPFCLIRRVALVTGASRGIGRAIALELALAGASVGLVARDERPLQEVADAIRRAGGRAAVIVTDLERAEAGAGAAAACEAELGPVEVLVNNAGVSSRASLDDLTGTAWRQMFRVNLEAVFEVCRAVAPGMRERRWGRIVNVASISGQTGGVRGSVAYASSKGGLIAFTKALARDLGPYEVTVNAVAPGQIETDMGGRLTTEQRNALQAHIPLGHLGAPEDVAWAVRFLASEQARYITGATLDVNGGISRR